MKILHIVEAFGGGVFDFLVNLTRGLNDMEHTIVYSIRQETPDDFQRYFGLNVRFIRRFDAQREVKPLQDFKAFLSLIKILKTQSADVYHLHSSKAGFLGRAALRFLGKSSKTIYSVHGLAFEDPEFSFLKRKIYKFLEKVAYRFGGKVVGNSMYEAQVLNEIGIKAKGIPNSFDCESVEGSGIALSLSSNKSKLVIANMGRLATVKDPGLFAKIAGKFSFDEEVEFWWIGGPLNDTMKFPSNVKITGWLSHKKALQKLAQIDIFLFTSASESVPMAVLEAMCLAKPVVTRKISGVKEVIEHGKNGFLFDNVSQAKQYLQMLIKDSQLRKRVGTQAKKTILKKYNFRDWIEKYRKLYQEIAN